MIDTHCHLTYDGLHDRLDEVLAAAAHANVDRMITVGTTPDDAGRAIALTQKHPGRLFATAGVHPGYSQTVADVPALQQRLRELLRTSGGVVVALGEMGLDQHYPEPPLEVQRPVFAAQLALMHDGWSGPAIIHNRKATDATLAMIRDADLPGERFVFHCFTGSSSELEAILTTGAMVSFTGIVTFSSAADLAEASDRVPLDRLMVETDSPYLTPAPHRKVRTNEPRYVADVARFLAARRGMALQKFVEAVDHNAERFFNLDQSK